jgi:hypothetical protein
MGARDNHLKWLLEPLMDLPGYLERPMFGVLACYLRGRLVLVLADREPPWNGLLVATSREHHGPLIKDFPALKPHDILGKWLFLPETHEDFETAATDIVDAVSREDPRIGVEPKPGKSRKGRGGRKKRKGIKPDEG